MDDKLRLQLLRTMDLGAAGPERQEYMLGKIELIARQRLASLAPDLLRPADRAELESLQAKGVDEAVVLKRFFELLPASYNSMLGTTMQAVADELAAVARQLHDIQ